MQSEKREVKLTLDQYETIRSLTPKVRTKVRLRVKQRAAAIDRVNGKLHAEVGDILDGLDDEVRAELERVAAEEGW
jgi:hypothetical protein